MKMPQPAAACRWMLVSMLLAACGREQPRVDAAAPPPTPAPPAVAPTPPPPEEDDWAPDPTIPDGIVADLEQDWGELEIGSGLRVDTVDLNRDGTPEYLVNGFCGSSGSCVGYAYARGPDGRLVRVLGAQTDEEGLRVRATRHHGWRDLSSAAPPEGTLDLPGLYRFDGRAYTPPGLPEVSPQGIELADFDRDGKLDLAISEGGAVAVLRGDGRGGFGAERDFDAGTGAMGMVAADLDGNGTLDLAAADGQHEGGGATVLPGDGRGGFGAPSAYPTGWDPYHLAVGDLNGDRRPDLVVANDRDEYLSVLLGSGGGRFLPRHRAPLRFPRAVALGDIDGDGHLDALATSEGGLAWLRGDGRGNLANADSFEIGWNLDGVAVADLDGNGRPDAVACLGSPAAVSVLMNHRGRLAAPRRVMIGRGCSQLLLEDLNGDGRKDLVAVSAGYANDVTVALGDGRGGFRVRQRIPAGRWPRDARLGDLDGDGRVDLVVVNEASDDLLVLLGRGDGTFTRHTRIVLKRPRR